MREAAQPVAVHAIAVTLTKDIPNGKNIQTCLRIYNDAASKDEATGRAIASAMEDNPEHQLFTVCGGEIFVARPRVSDEHSKSEDRDSGLSAQHASAVGIHAETPDHTPQISPSSDNLVERLNSHATALAAGYPHAREVVASDLREAAQVLSTLKAERDEAIREREEARDRLDEVMNATEEGTDALIARIMAMPDEVVLRIKPDDLREAEAALSSMRKTLESVDNFAVRIAGRKDYAIPLHVLEQVEEALGKSRAALSQETEAGNG
ncbi:hypothetical protein [Microvirga lotononidis]|uniref:hypothetical protein n=1 Tax=Microvirga lotononidis TaxID=864069 RepID=UPI0012B5E79F|nr:hypothetical protein [Microvirga lotononidis]WQO25638.1 hypothetical protein U0023_13020 [Microvirga lotononidis]